jgi:RNA polymerase sigma-70 factor, ECF subfamily
MWRHGPIEHDGSDRSHELFGRTQETVMNAATRHYEIDAQREISKPAPTLFLVPTQQEPTVAGNRPAADEKSLSELWRIHGIVLTRFALKLTLGDLHRAEDIVQETLLRAWRHPEVVDGHAETIRPWLFTVSRHVAIDMWRAKSRRDNNVVEEQLTDRPNPVDGIDQAMTAMDIRAALAQLTPEHRQVIVQAYYLGRSVTEIAALLSIPEGTVKSRTYYGLRQLKRLLSVSSGEQAERAPALSRPALSPQALSPQALTA